MICFENKFEKLGLNIITRTKLTKNKFSFSKISVTMPKTCAVIGCYSRSSIKVRKFFRFPMLNKLNAKTMAFTKTRQDAWVKALNRIDFFPNNYKNATVCDLHFVSGLSAHYNDVANVDWIPTLNLGYEPKKEPNNSNNVQPSEDEQLIDQSQHDRIDEVLHDVHEEIGQNNNEKETQTDFKKSAAATQTEDEVTGMSENIIYSYEEKIAYLEEILSTKNVSLENFRGQNKKTNFFTGITDFSTLEALYQLVEPEISYSRKVSKFEILMIVLSRLRLNLSFRFLSYQYPVAIPTISKHFHKTLNVLYAKLRYFVYWPDREAIRKTMPLAFQSQFGVTIVVIIDCFEVFIEKPANPKAAAQCFSSYKHAYTIKYLIGITPQGFISFISKGYGGRSSDKFVTESCGIFDKLLNGDVVMADRGFLIENELRNRGVELQIPAFTKGKSQLHPREIESTRRIANVRIHVERIIGQLRLKFQILHQSKFPISLITKKSPFLPNTIDKILTVCCALSNLCAPIVCKEEENE